MLFRGLLLALWISEAVSDCIQREIDPTGTEYRGFLTRTSTGHKCKVWGYLAQSFPDSGLTQNVCRNPGGSHTTPWCYTDEEYGWGVCDIPDCEVLECISYEKDRSGKMYRGHQDTDDRGNKCLDWSETKHSPDQFPDAGLEDGNYCRNPGTIVGNARPFFRPRPWCYISEKKISYCDIDYCEDLQPSDEMDDAGQLGLTIGCIPYDEDPTGAGYRGSKKLTRSQTLCQPWHEIDQMMFPYSDLNGAVCRNPGGLDPTPWCYTGQNSWEACDIPSCTERPLECNEGELVCQNGRQCISSDKNCDGTPDCDDESDEVECF